MHVTATYLAEQNQHVDRAAGYIHDVKWIHREYGLFAEDKASDCIGSMKEKYKPKYLLDSFFDASNHGGHIFCFINMGEWQVFPREGVC